MCGIAGIIHIRGQAVPGLRAKLALMNDTLRHRGPDGEGLWTNANNSVGLAHRRLAIIDLSPTGAQPMLGDNDAALVHNGEIYNFVELRNELKDGWRFKGASDTETIIAAHERHGDDAVSRFRGMFAYALWDERKQRLVASRDRFGIKPFYHAVVGEILYFASEIKALLPFLPEVETNKLAFAEYLTFQFNLGEQTLFERVRQLSPAHQLIIENGQVKVRRYWDVAYKPDFSHTPIYFEERLRELVNDSLRLHLRSDVPVGAYVSGGIDSSLVAIMSSRHASENNLFFHGKFTDHPGYDESPYAEEVARLAGGELRQIDISAQMFLDNIEKVIYHLDHPVAGPGSFPQYMVSQLAGEHVKVVLGGQGGDEIFGGYARYLIAYLEQCLNAAIDGTYKNGNYVVTIESIIPRMGVLREYKPLLKMFWERGLFGPLDERYFRLISRNADMEDEINLADLPMDAVFERYRAEFNRANVGHEAYFDKMTHFDFKFLLPALLQVEDRMGMAHGLESRVPFLDHPIVEFAASMPADVKFKSGEAKHIIKHAYRDVLPRPLLERRDKMGFPVPLKEWMGAELREFALDTLSSQSARSRPYLNSTKAVAALGKQATFSRKTWGLMSLELWHRQFHDRAHELRKTARALESA